MSIWCISPSFHGLAVFFKGAQLGIKRLEAATGCSVCLPADYMEKKNPLQRAKEAWEALHGDGKFVISSIGGSGCEDILPFFDRWHADVSDLKDGEHNIYRPPFVGFSDLTWLHAWLFSMGRMSYYGPSLLTSWSEPVRMYQHTLLAHHQAFSGKGYMWEPYTKGWTNAFYDWADDGHLLIQRPEQHPVLPCWKGGKKSASGVLWGGCLEVLCALPDHLWIRKEKNPSVILFLDVASDHPKAYDLWQHFWHNILPKRDISVSGVIVGRYGGRVDVDLWDAYDAVIDAYRPSYPVITRCDFGHTEPVRTIPYGRLCSLNPEQRSIHVHASDHQ